MGMPSWLENIVFYEIYILDYELSINDIIKWIYNYILEFVIRIKVDS